MAISYRSYCWVVGTTSFRTNQLNRKIELQLQYLDEFWSDIRYAGKPWSDNEPLQAAYYRLLKGKGFEIIETHEKRRFRSYRDAEKFYKLPFKTIKTKRAKLPGDVFTVNGKYRITVIS